MSREEELMKENKKQIFTPTTFHVQEDDTITSKKGILQQCPITKGYYLVKKFRIMGKGYVEVIGNKEKINVKVKK